MANYLIQAYACSPNRGGEFGVSWGWLTHLDKVVSDEDTIYVVSLTLRETDIKENSLKHVVLIPVKNMHLFEFLSSTPFYYWIWQRMAYYKIKQQKIHLDFVHVYSLSDFRQPGIWYKLNNCETVFGPVGGGQVCPKGLEEYDNRFGKVRSIINKLCTINPFFIKKIKKYSRVYACNYETAACLKKSHILADVPLQDTYKELPVCDRIKNSKLTILCAGRLINKKGFLFLLDVIDRLNVTVEDLDYEVHVYGDGEQRVTIQEKINEKHLENKVILKGLIPYEEMQKAYRNADIFVLPSLRESGGNVLVEAMANALPIVALDMSFSRILNEKQTGLFVDTSGSKQAIIKEFADALCKLLRDAGLRNKLGINGYSYVNKELNWDVMIHEIYNIDNNEERISEI